jgi:polysaccharide chain length determinant protein (PEP-CTERM system associated)
MIPGKKYTPEDILRIAWRRKWLMLVPLVVISLGTFAVVRRLPNKYRAETTILVVPQRVPDTYVHATVTSTIDDRLRSISEEILSRARLERIIQDYNLYPAMRRKTSLEDVVERMRRDITVEPAKGGTTFVITYTSDDAMVARWVTETLASMFIEGNVRDRVALADGTSQFLESQLEDARQRLIAHEKKLEAYREKYAGELPSQLDTNMHVAQNAEARVQALAESINRDRDRKLLQERLLADLDVSDTPAAAPAGAPAAVRSDPATDALEAARATLAELQLRYKPDYPDVIRAKREVARLEAKADLEKSRPQPSPAEARPVRLTAAEAAQRNKVRELQLEIQNLDHQIAEKQAEQTRLNEVIATYQRRIAAVPTHESELTELMRDYETLQKSYTSLLARKEDSKTAADLERRQIGEQFKILDPAREPERPISPKRAQLYAMGTLFGLAIGVGLAGFLEYRDTSLKTEDDVVQTLMLPVLALIPTMGTTPAGSHDRQKPRALLPWVG